MVHKLISVEVDRLIKELPSERSNQNSSGRSDGRRGLFQQFRPFARDSASGGCIEGRAV